MWFKRKKKNRAFTRKHVLDVKVCSAVIRRTRLRAAGVALSISLGTIFGVYIFWRCASWAVDKLIYENKAFAIHQIDVQTDGVIALEQLRNWAGVKLEDNLFTVDLTRIKRDLELSPAIQSAAVERVLPHTLKIRVVEREPIAQITVPVFSADMSEHTAVYLLDAIGHVMLPLELKQRSGPPQPSETYPAITGTSVTEVRSGRQVESSRIQAALRFISEFKRSAMAECVDLERIDLSINDTLKVTTVQQNEVILRTSDFARQLHRWRLVYDRGLQENRIIATLDLSVADHVPLRWSEASGIPSPAPKEPKNSAYKKKHV